MSYNKNIIVIDFDKTLYKKDSLIEFCKYVYGKKPIQIWAILPQIFAYLLHSLKLISTKKFKEYFLMFLYGINENDVDILATQFWEETGMENFHSNITALLNRKEYKIICISASPEIYLKPIMYSYQLEYIGTKLIYQKNKYIIEGENCKGVEKVNRLKILLNTDYIQLAESYSDSLTDTPLFNISDKAYLVDEDGTPQLINIKSSVQ